MSNDSVPFCVLVCHSYIFSGDMSVQIFCPLKKPQVVGLLIIELQVFFIYSGKALYQIYIWKCFLPVCGLTFHFLNSIFQDRFQFCESLIYNFFFGCGLWFLGAIYNIFWPNPRTQIFFFCVFFLRVSDFGLCSI